MLWKSSEHLLFFSVLNAARKNSKSLSLLLPFLFTHMLLICIREKFFVAERSQAYEECYLIAVSQIPRKNFPTEREIIPARISFTGTGKQSDRFIREEEFSHVKFWPLVFQLLLWPMFIFIAKKFPNKTFPRCPARRTAPSG